MKIAIVGAGWFGCHLGMALRREFDVTIFEKESDVFQGASGVNQNRLHLGFHYPRSASTRNHAQAGFREFMGEYGFLTEYVNFNLYAIADHVSLMDYDTYLAIMGAQGLDFQIRAPEQYGLTNCEGAIQTEERLIRNDKAAKYFREELADCLRLKRAFRFADLDSGFDVIINCSSQLVWAKTSWNLVYEPCAMLTYKPTTKQPSPAVTVMDGPLCTVYPKWDGRFTLYSVEHSSLGCFKSAEDALERLKQAKAENQPDPTLLERRAQTYIPWFVERFEYERTDYSIRATFGDAARSRVPHVHQHNNMIQVLPCKIDNIFEAEREVRRLLHRDVEL